MTCQREGDTTLQAIRVMRDQSAGGHIFNMDGAGADGGATPRFAAYGATKRSLAQLSKSLQVLQTCLPLSMRGQPMFVLTRSCACLLVESWSASTFLVCSVNRCKRAPWHAGRAEAARHNQCGYP